jgi:hypothetical protein
MANININKTVEMLDGEFQSIWELEPLEVQTLKKITGAFNTTGPVLLFVESETRELMDYLWIVQVMMKEGKISDEVGKVMFQEMLRFKGMKWINWYRLHHTAKLMQDAAEALGGARNRDEIMKVVESLTRYLNKWNFWLEQTIPWANIAFVYDASLGKC